MTKCDNEKIKAGRVSDIYEIADYYGFKSQSVMLIEEMSELTKAITRYKRFTENGQPVRNAISKVMLKENIAEEIADVEVVLEEIKYLLDIEQLSVNTIKAEKIERTLKLIKTGENYKWE